MRLAIVPWWYRPPRELLSPKSVWASMWMNPIFAFFTLGEPFGVALKGRVGDVMIAAHDHWKTSAFHHLAHALDDRFGGLHQVVGVDVEVAQVSDVGVFFELRAHLGVEIDAECVRRKIVTGAREQRRFSDGSRVEPRSDSAAVNSVVDGDSGDDGHPFGDVVESDLRQSEERDRRSRA